MAKLISNRSLLAVTAALSVLVVLLSSSYYFEIGNGVSLVYAQQQLPRSDSETPFKLWYDEQKKQEQIINPLLVKIESPAKGQEVPSAQNLIVSGISSDNSTSDCKVSVIVNSIKPYQPAVASGTGGANDYSAWNFMITPKYTTIKEGPDNKITSKLECAPDLTKWYSVNVTGVEATTNINREEIQTPFTSTPSSPITFDNNNNAQSSGSVGNRQGSLLAISLDVTETSGGEQTIEAAVLDADSDSPIENAIIELKLTDEAGNIIDEFSDDDGDISYVVQIGETGAGGTEDGESIIPNLTTATVQASAVGYEPESKTTTFDVIEQGEVEGTESDEIVGGEDLDPSDDSGDDDLGELFE